MHRSLTAVASLVAGIACSGEASARRSNRLEAYAFPSAPRGDESGSRQWSVEVDANVVALTRDGDTWLRLRAADDGFDMSSSVGNARVRAHADGTLTLELDDDAPLDAERADELAAMLSADLDAVDAGSGRADALSVGAIGRRLSCLTIIDPHLKSTIGAIAAGVAVLAASRRARGLTQGLLQFTGASAVSISAVSLAMTDIVRANDLCARAAARPLGYPNRTRPRTVGLFVGIADYPGVASDFAGDGPAIEVRQLAAMLITGGVVRAEDAVILTNTDARYDAVRRALAHLSSLRLSSADQIVFAFSGHGLRVVPRGDSYEILADEDPRMSSRESESILVLAEGDVLPTEALRYVRDRSPARLTLMLDTCYAGGFENALGPTDVALFSSPATRTSSYVRGTNAYGYVMGPLTNALTGDADREPRDGVITMAELRAEFDRGHSTARPPGAEFPYPVWRIPPGSPSVLFELD